MVHDLVIRGGFIVDGTGAAGRAGDVAVSGGRIAEVGAVSRRMAPCRPQDRLTLMKMLESVDGMSLEAMPKGMQ